MKSIQQNEDGVLTKMFRKIIMETGYVNTIVYFINRYKGKKNKASIYKLVLDGELTWNSFTFLLITILKSEDLTIYFYLYKKDKEIASSKIEFKPDTYSEKQSGKELKKCFLSLCDRLGYNSKDLTDLTTKYFKNGGKKNKATIGKTLRSDSMSWKSFMFLIIELLDTDKAILEVEFTSLVKKTTNHELVITKDK